MQTMHALADESHVSAYRNSDFFNHLSAAALADLESMMFPSSHPANTILFSETQPSAGIVIILEGEIKLSMNSSDGRRLSLRIAKAGEVLGLSSTLSGSPYEVTADTLYPVKIAHISRNAFLQFLTRHPDAYQAVARDMARRFNGACEQLRTVGLSSSVPEKLARLLLDWSDAGQKSETGSRCRLSLTHEQIGEFIGASRETVTRTLSSFKNRRLVDVHGSMLTIPSRTALASCAHN
jgi:CRP/FNR family cyclic AMP-dependent transcriptional regulator